MLHLYCLSQVLCLLEVWVSGDQSGIIFYGGGNSEGSGIGNGKLSFDFCCIYDRRREKFGNWLPSLWSKIMAALLSRGWLLPNFGDWATFPASLLL